MDWDALDQRVEFPSQEVGCDVHLDTEVPIARASISLSIEAGKSRWALDDVLQLVHLKQVEWEEYKLAGCRGKTKNKADKWTEIENQLGVLGILKSAKACREKWENISRDWKIIWDYESHIPSGQDAYWDMNSKDRRAKKVPGNFIEIVYTAMSNFMADKATNIPPALFDSGDIDAKSIEQSAKEGDPKLSTRRKRKRVSTLEGLAGILKANAESSAVLTREVSDAQVKATENAAAIQGKARTDATAILAQARKEESQDKNRRHTEMLQAQREVQASITSAIQMLAFAISGRAPE